MREERMEDAYQIRSASETAFQAYADFDKQQERIAMANRPAGLAFLPLSDTPARINGHLSAGAHGMPGLSALSAAAPTSHAPTNTPISLCPRVMRSASRPRAMPLCVAFG